MTTAANLRFSRNAPRRTSLRQSVADLWQEPYASSHWLLGVLAVQFAAQLALMTSLGGARSVVRSVSFAASLACLFLVPKGGLRHPTRSWAFTILGLVFVQLLNPETAGFLGGAVHAGMYLSILAPVFWVSRLKIDIADFRRIITFFWAYYALSALIGMLQVYFPGRFEPDVASLAASATREGLKITLASGERIFRPMGLTDAPGGAATAGFYTVVVGGGLLLERAKWWWRAVVLAGMVIGVFVIYLSHVRSLLVMSVICMLASAAVLGVRGRPGKFVFYGLLIAAIFGVAWSLAVDIGGDSVRDRVGSLTEGSMRDVYYKNRGHFLESTLDDLLPKYPLGAGLARWGTMALYFGDFTSSSIVYTEIQWTGWLLDGSVAMLIAYPGALLISLWTAAKIAMGRLGAGSSDLWIWGGVMVGYNVGAIAITFNAPLFMGTAGTEFWMLNAMLFVVATRGDHFEAVRRELDVS